MKVIFDHLLIIFIDFARRNVEQEKNPQDPQDLARLRAGALFRDSLKSAQFENKFCQYQNCLYFCIVKRRSPRGGCQRVLISVPRRFGRVTDIIVKTLS